jgi:hypothetical protein
MPATGTPIFDIRSKDVKLVGHSTDCRQYIKHLRSIANKMVEERTEAGCDRPSYIPIVHREHPDDFRYLKVNDPSIGHQEIMELGEAHWRYLTPAEEVEANNRILNQLNAIKAKKFENVAMQAGSEMYKQLLGSMAAAAGTITQDKSEKIEGKAQNSQKGK